MSSTKSKYEGIIEILAHLVKDNVYGPVDRLARAADLNMVRVAIYEAIRYISTEVRRGVEVVLPDENEIKAFLDEIEHRGVGVAKRIAIEALTKGLHKQRKEKQQEKVEKVM